MMYLTIKQKLKHLSKDEYLTLKELSHIAKDLTNQAIYNIRQNFFNKKYLNNYQHYSFSGKRIKRGVYKTKNNKIINADVNGALNILKKSKVVSLNGLYNSGEVNTPIRIRNFSNFL